MTLILDRTDTVILDESILNGEPKCEYGHWGVDPCTVAVTHRVRGCRPPAFNVCASAAEVITVRLTRDLCTECGRAAGACWKMRPV